MYSIDNSTIKQLVARYGISVKEPESYTNNEIKQLCRYIKVLLLHEEQPEPADTPSEEQIGHLCDSLNNKMSDLRNQLCELHQAKHSANLLGKKFVSQYERYLEHLQRYHEYQVNFHAPYEKSKNEVTLAKSEYNQAIARLGSLEEKYQNRDKLAELCRLKEYLDEEESRIDKEIQQTKIRIHEYQSLDPELLDEYKRLKSELEMNSILLQIDASSMSVEQIDTSSMSLE